MTMKLGAIQYIQEAAFTYMLDSGVETAAEAFLRVGAPGISSGVELQVSGKDKGMSLEAVGRSAINVRFHFFASDQADAAVAA